MFKKKLIWVKQEVKKHHPCGCPNSEGEEPTAWKMAVFDFSRELVTTNRDVHGGWDDGMLHSPGGLRSMGGSN